MADVKPALAGRSGRQRGPCWLEGSSAGARVQAQAGDGHVGVAGVGEDRHPAPDPGEPQHHEFRGVHRRGQQAGAVQGEGDGSRAVIAGGDERGVTAAVDVGQPDELVAGPDDLLDGGAAPTSARPRGLRRSGRSMPGTSSSGLVSAVDARQGCPPVTPSRACAGRGRRGRGRPGRWRSSRRPGRCRRCSGCGAVTRSRRGTGGSPERSSPRWAGRRVAGCRGGSAAGRGREARGWPTRHEQRQAAQTIALRVRTRNNNLFRRPAGLADGLALKEPALLTVLPWDSPQQLGSPVP